MRRRFLALVALAVALPLAACNMPSFGGGSPPAAAVAAEAPAPAFAPRPASLPRMAAAAAVREAPAAATAVLPAGPASPAFIAPGAPAPSTIAVTVAAPSPTAVEVHWGDRLLQLVQWLASVLIPIAVAGLGFVRGPIGMVLRAYLTEKKMAELVGYGLNAVAGAAKGKVLTVDVGSQVLAVVAQRALDDSPRYILKLLGGEEGIRAKALAMLHLEPDASTETLAVSAAAAPPAAA
jgi:hypothetical protein